MCTNWNDIEQNNTKINESRKSTRTEYVFFCEGPTEAKMLKFFQQKLNNVLLKVYRIPNLRSVDTFLFTPKRIADYCERVLSYVKDEEFQEEWPYSYEQDFDANIESSDNIAIVQDLRQNKQIPIYLLVDTDVFFKGNLQDKNRYSNGLDRIFGQTVKDTLRYFEDAARNYRFCEQELNFEDFFVICFGEDEIYEEWFNARFGERYNIKNNITKRDYTTTKNDNEKGDEIKRRLEETIGMNVLDWLEQNVENINENIKRCKRRMKENENKYITENGEHGPNGWPYRFGLVDVLEKHII